MRSWDSFTTFIMKWSFIHACCDTDLSFSLIWFCLLSRVWNLWFWEPWSVFLYVLGRMSTWTVGLLTDRELLLLPLIGRSFTSCHLCSIGRGGVMQTVLFLWFHNRGFGLSWGLGSGFWQVSVADHVQVAANRWFYVDPDGGLLEPLWGVQTVHPYHPTPHHPPGPQNPILKLTC